MKNLKLGAKLILVGTAIMVIPLFFVAIAAISWSTRGLRAVENEQLAERSKDIAQMIDKVFEQEKKIALNLSIDADITAAATTLAEKPAAELLGGVDEKLRQFVHTKGLGDGYQALLVIGLDGVSVAASDMNYVGVNVSDSQYFKDAMAGEVNAGAAALNQVTKKPFTPFAAPIRSGDNVIGVFAALLDIGFLNDLIASNKIGTSGYAFITDKTGLVLAHPKPSNVFLLNIAELPGMSELAKAMMAGESGVRNYVFERVPRTAGFVPVSTTGWSVSLTLPDSEYLAPCHLLSLLPHHHQPAGKGGGFCRARGLG
jgi:methyl-accepting chemotaxis protein